MALEPSAAGSATASLATDTASLDRVRRAARSDPAQAAREVGKQFEALFMQTLLKSMRDAMPDSGLWKSSDQSLYQGMLDAQWAQSLSGRPGGLAHVIERQLARHVKPASDAATPASADPTAVAPTTSQPVTTTIPAPAPAQAPSPQPLSDAARLTVPSASATGAGERERAFIARHLPAAQRIERETGVSANHIISQAALETGWGRQEMRDADGRPAHNLFGIKATGRWSGDTVQALTTEYTDGRPVRTKERFRAYESYEDSMRDWARLIVASPRYAEVARSGTDAQSFAAGLQRGGYATDPAYAEKLTRVINRTIELRAAAGGSAQVGRNPADMT